MSSSRQIVTGPPASNPAVPGQGLMVPADRVDLSGSVSFFRRRLGLILAIVAAALVLGVIVTFARAPVYTAHAMVGLEAPAEADAQTAGGARTAGPAPSSSFVDTQVEIITSRQMAQRVAQSLGLLAGTSDAARRELLDRMQSAVRATRNGESYALTLTYAAESGDQAARHANAFATQFTQWEVSSLRERNADSRKLVATRVDELRRQAQADTAALQHYRIANNLLSTSGASLTEQEISSYNQEVTRAEAEAAADRARYRTALAQLNSGSTGEDVGEALGSPVISSLRAREAEIGGQVANLRARYGPNHPELVRSNGELTEIQRQIQSEIGRVISNLEAKQTVSQQRVSSLVSSLAAARGQLSSNNAAMIGLDELQRRALASQGLYETYLNSYKQLVAGEGAERPNARILSLAEAPTLPSSPNIVMNMLLSLALGLGLGVLAAYIAEGLFHGISSADEIESGLSERYLGSIPLLSSVSKTARREVPALVDEPRSAFAESFRALRTSIEQAVLGPAQVMAVTSALPKEGKTTLAACLAQTLALGGASTILVDCDLRRRGVSRLLQLRGDQPGLVEVLQRKVELADAVIAGDTGLSVLPVRATEGDPEGLLVGDEFAWLIRTLRTRYDQVVLDLPPILPIAATRVMATHADATIMVVRWLRTPLSAVRAALHQLPRERLNLVGIALSQVDMRRRSRFGRNDPSFYYRLYRKYYQ